jgi:hypothetical protein
LGSGEGNLKFRSYAIFLWLYRVKWKDIIRQIPSIPQAAKQPRHMLYSVEVKAGYVTEHHGNYGLGRANADINIYLILH